MPVLPHLVETPELVRPRFGLFDTINVKPLPEKGIGGGIQYDSEFCGWADAFAAPCEEPEDPKFASDGVDQATGLPITAYHLFSCRLIGGVDFETRAARSLDLGAARLVESRFIALIGAAAQNATPPSGAMPIERAIARLEARAATLYGGQAVIHLSREAATLAFSAEVIFRVGDHLETGLGTLVIAGAGYADSTGPAADPAGTEWAYATGAVNVFGGDISTGGQVLERGTGGGYTNEAAALSERVYVPTFECFAEAVLVQIAEETP